MNLANLNLATTIKKIAASPSGKALINSFFTQALVGLSLLTSKRFGRLRGPIVNLLLLGLLYSLKKTYFSGKK